VEHVVDELAIAHAVPGARLEQQVRRVAHGLEAAGERHGRVAIADLIGGEHQRLHAGAAHLVHGRRGHRRSDARGERSLPRGSLAEPGREHAAEHHFVERVTGDAGVRQGGACSGSAELGGAGAGEHALESADRRAAGSHDHGFGHRNPLRLLVGARRSGRRQHAPRRVGSSVCREIFAAQDDGRASRANRSGAARHRSAAQPRPRQQPLLEERDERVGNLRGGEGWSARYQWAIQFRAPARANATIFGSTGPIEPSPMPVRSRRRMPWSISDLSALISRRISGPRS